MNRETQLTTQLHILEAREKQLTQKLDNCVNLLRKSEESQHLL